MGVAGIVGAMLASHIVVRILSEILGGSTSLATLTLEPLESHELLVLPKLTHVLLDETLFFGELASGLQITHRNGD